MLRDADNDERLALGVVLGGMDAIVESRAVIDAVLDVDPDKVGLGRRQQLGDEHARDSLGNAEKGLDGIGLCVFERLLEVCWLRQQGRPVWGPDVGRRLLEVRFAAHDEDGW